MRNHCCQSVSRSAAPSAHRLTAAAHGYRAPSIRTFLRESSTCYSSYLVSGTLKCGLNTCCHTVVRRLLASEWPLFNILVVHEVHKNKENKIT